MKIYQNYAIKFVFECYKYKNHFSLELCGYVGPVCVPFPIKAPIEKGKLFYFSLNFFWRFITYPQVTVRLALV